MKYIVVALPSAVLTEFENESPVYPGNYVEVDGGFHEVIQVSTLVDSPDTKILRVGGAFAHIQS